MIVPYIFFNISCCPFNLNTKTARFEKNCGCLWTDQSESRCHPRYLHINLKFQLLLACLRQEIVWRKKRSIQMCKTRESKRRNCDDEESNLSDDLDDEIPTCSDYDSDEDETFNPAIEKLDEDAAMEIHVG